MTVEEQEEKIITEIIEFANWCKVSHIEKKAPTAESKTQYIFIVLGDCSFSQRPILP